MERFDAIIIGAGAGRYVLFCAGRSGRTPGSAGSIMVKTRAQNPHVWRWALQLYQPLCRTGRLSEPESAFCKSALARFTQWDFIDLVNKHGIAWHEKTLGSSSAMTPRSRLSTCWWMSARGQCAFRLRSEVLSVAKDDTGFTLELNGMTVGCEKLVIATGGLSMPGLGASPFGYKIAEQFGLNVLPTRAGLVPFTLHKPLLEELQVLAGVAVPSVIPLKTVPFSVRTLLHPPRLIWTGGVAGFPATGNRVNLSASICYRMWTSKPS